MTNQSWGWGSKFGKVMVFLTAFEGVGSTVGFRSATTHQNCFQAGMWSMTMVEPLFTQVKVHPVVHFIYIYIASSLTCIYVCQHVGGMTAANLGCAIDRTFNRAQVRCWTCTTILPHSLASHFPFASLHGLLVFTDWIEMGRC